jgi:hypothetical protein
MAILESLLAYLHIAAFLAIVVFMTSLAALCRPQWLNASAVAACSHVSPGLNRGARALHEVQQKRMKAKVLV